MDRCLWALCVMVVCLAVSVSEVLGLECYSCAYIHPNTDDANVAAYLATFTTNDAACADPINPSGTYVNKMTCSPATGKTAVCGKTKAQGVSATYSGVTFTGSFYNRGCLDVASGGDACGLTTDTHKAQLQAIAASATINSFSGTACTCTGDLCNAQTRLNPEKVACLVGLLVAMAVNKLW